ncbi:hypothetical protein TGP89_297270A [Toxoplasma gondii p89]|uniref:Transmembrane protein n=1 Tax=Toxoplasma gondii p89 TaxID=943119 RepID=A0A086JCQ2_TOXGO|nr:hypothetical protein TGP89_297270A [Toxoplasma gondii p89]
MPPLSGLLPCFILLSFFLSRFCSAKILFGEADLFRQRVAPGAAQLQTSSPPHRFSPSLAALLCIPKRSFSSPAHSVSSSSRPSSSSSARLRASSSSSSALRTSSSASSHSSLSSLSSPLNRPLFSRCPCGTANEEGASLLCIRAAGLSSAEPPPRGFSLSNACASVPAFLSLSHLSLLSEVSRACLSTAQRPFRSSLHATRRRAASESPGVAACALFWASVGIPRSALRGLSGWAAWRVARAETAAERLLPSSTKVHMVWGYPIFGDDPKKLRRKKVDHAWERGLSRANLAWEYETANKLAQGM